ncbi:hypothetical protein [Haloarchaeobius sp. HME9146]|uniref:hypothetical protein n=1 Tax=Haloarchaeobius sp. HME9146 TaxID=2978732 RepID=UPI0021C1B476|nr:hypothetical protein [Haloarchaeobius sp. HME9146]MCT9096237.1 hypothetical protein [Haloarchaeobius sp. HME9146]
MNTAIAGGLALTAWWAGSTELGGTVFVASLLVIYLRGYLVPGTPTLTKLYLPTAVLRLFDKHEPSLTAGTAGDAVDTSAWLREHGLVSPCDDRDDLCVSPTFERAWTAEMAAIDEGEYDRGLLVNVVDVGQDDVEFRSYDDSFVARAADTRVAQWESEAAFVADVAAARVLADRVDGWTTLSGAVRGELLNGLRLFVPSCPACTGSLAFSEDTYESCCRTRDVTRLECTSCGELVLEQSVGE